MARQGLVDVATHLVVWVLAALVEATLPVEREANGREVQWVVE